MNKLPYLLMAFVSVLYIINPTAGFFELLPDNLPLIGNLDEAAAVTLFLYAMRQLGVDLNKWFSRSSESKNVVRRAF